MKIAKMEISLIDKMGSDQSVCNAARVSFHKEASQYTEEQNQKLIAYLAKHNHWSPFAHTSLQFRIKAPIFLARQLVKHQVGGVWNEVSRRYVSDEPEFWFPEVWRGKPENAKQGSNGIIDISNTYVEFFDGYSMLGISDVVEYAFKMYTQLLEDGVAPEQARMILPQNTMTEWIWTGSLMFFARVYNLRKDSHAQKEAQEFAEMLAKCVPEEFKHSWKVLTND